jgi:S-DNA-T family DNA segregation ATPase FtsK/SpoIIIE
MSSFVIANATFQIVKNAFSRNGNAAHQCFRVKNLQQEEVCELVRLWDALSAGTDLGLARLVVADDLNGRIPTRHVAELGKSITYYRNHNDRGLIYLETKVQSDEQGLQNIFSLRDSNFLDGSFDEYAGVSGGVPELMLSSAWTQTTSSTGKVPSLLMERVLQIINLIHPAIESVPVRRFVAFALETCAQWHASTAAKDAEVADRLIGECLHQLEIFPDPLWRHGESDVRVKRRLELNTRHAELVSGGSELDQDELSKLARNTRFLDETGQELSNELIQTYAQLCSQYAMGPTGEVRRRIPYPIFEQLFKKDATGLKLGDRVRTEVEGADLSRLAELDAINVVQGLNAKLQADAERLLTTPPPVNGSKPLIDLLSGRTRKAIERVAAPPATNFSNPIVQLVRIIRQLQVQDESVHAAKLEVTLVDGAPGNGAMRGLFAFLYGATLKSLAEATRGVPGACELIVDPRLTEPCGVPPLTEDLDDEEDSDQGPITWGALPLSISISDESGRLIEALDRVEWTPENVKYLALFWLLAVAPDSPAWAEIGVLVHPESVSSDDWLTALVQRDQSLDLIVLGEMSLGAGASSVTDELLDIRRQLRQSFCHTGLSTEAVNDYYDAWQALQAEVRVDHIPDGTRPAVLEAVLSTDLLAFNGDTRRLMLPTHPLRLRWISSYLQRCCRLAESSLNGLARFTLGAGEQYLDWLEALSPHETPPTAMGRAGEILHARAEVAWFEEYAPLSKVTADVSVDQQALISIGARILDYIQAHPFKRDGLALLVLMPSSDQMPAQLLELITKGQNDDLRVALTVAAPKVRWERIARLVEALPGEERKSGRGRLFPARDLAFIDFDQGGDLAMAMDNHAFDIAVVAHVLQESVVSQQNTEPTVEGRAGAFDPVMDRPVRLESAGSGGAISIVMRPREPDTALDTWGTLVVRANRSCPVSPSQPENIDFVELRINFQDSARIFNVLHQRCHWVITLERHISREQIESVEAGSPDVLSIENGIGNNGLSTLIVSSHSGRVLIEARLAKKLRKLIPDVNDPRRTGGFLNILAARVYDETRKLSPHLALQAMGIARVTEEILGLCVARRLADQEYPGRVSDGLLAWISLDEHTSWFGGTANVRADMCRVAIQRMPDGTLDLTILVIEGKFRQNFDAHGITQVARTSAFLAQILASTRDDVEPNVDAEMWRERFLVAIESVAADAIRIVRDGVAVEPEQSRVIPPDIRQLFREGKYRISAVNGLYSICLWENTDAEVARERKDSVTVLRASRAQIVDLIGRPDKGVDVAPIAEHAVMVSERQSGSEETPCEVTPEATTSERHEAGASSPDAAQALLQIATSSNTEEHQAIATNSANNGAAPATMRGMTVTELAAMYDEVLGCFASHNVAVMAAPASEQPIIEGPASVMFKVRAGSGVDPRKLFEKSQALKLKLELDQDQNVSFDIDKGYVTIDVPKRSEFRYFVNAADMWARWSRPVGELSVPLGEDRFGELVVVNFSSSNSPHLLVAGTTGSGKSEALNTMLFGLARFYDSTELKLMLVDPKGTELLPFENSPHLIGEIGWDDSDALTLLKCAVEEMQLRYETFRSKRCRSLADFNTLVGQEERLPWWLIVLDEYADLTHDPLAKKEIEQELKRLAQKARAAGIHVIIATQKPSADVISTNLRSNLPAQLALRVKSGTESRVVLDEAGAENLNGKGDALLKADGKLRRVQCARVAKEDQILQ